MRPKFRLEVNGGDVTDAISDKVLQLRVNDDSGQKSDTVDITLDDRGNMLDVPAQRAELKVWIGYEETDLTYMGSYTIDEVSFTDSPATMKVRAKAADSSPEFRATKTRSWHHTTIGEIVTTIAGEHGLIPSVHASLASVEIHHIDQENESDAHFLTRLAKTYGAVAKPADGKLIFMPEGQGLSPSGATLSPADVDRNELSAFKATIKDRGVYSGVITRYRDKASNQELEVTVTDNWDFFGSGPMFRDKKLYTSQDMAQKAGIAKLKQLKTGTITLDFTVRGRPDIFAERPVNLTNVRSPLAGQWIVKTVTHTMSASGFVTKVQAGNKAD